MCALITFHTQTSKFIINKQPQSLYHTESLDPSVERQGCCVSLGEAKEKKGEVLWQGRGINCFHILLFGAFLGGGEDNFKGYVNGALNVGTKGLKVSGDLAVNVILWL